MCWFAPVQTKLAGLVDWKEKRNFLCQKRTSSDNNAIANGAGPDENIHKEQSRKLNTVCHLNIDSFNSAQPLMLF